MKNKVSQSPTEEEVVPTNKSQIVDRSQLSYLNEDETLIRAKGTGSATKSSADQQSLKQNNSPSTSSITTKGTSVGIDIGEYKSPNWREKLGAILMNKYMDLFFIILILVYIALVVVNVIVEDGCSADHSTFVESLHYCEVAILGVFILEIILKVIALGPMEYFKDCWYIFDAVIILISLALVIVDLKVEANIKGLSELRGLFRLFRIFLLYRKATTFTSVAKKRIRTGGFHIKSPVETVIELLSTLRNFTKDKETLREINWAIEIVSSNKLYDVIIERETTEEGSNEVTDWLKSCTPVINVQERRKALLYTIPVKVNEKKERKDSHSHIDSNLPQEVTAFLDKDVYELGFDVFQFSKLIPGHELISMMQYLFHQHHLFDSLEINIPTFTKLADKIQHGYRNNPYHNAIHATDVLQTVAYFTIKCGFKDSAELDQLDLGALFFSAAIHDYDHPGYNNMYHVNAQHELAIRYNDKAVLENYHVACAYSLMQAKEYNIFVNLSKADYKIMREKVIALILATDMSQHFAELTLLKTRLASDFDKKAKDKLLCMKMILHSSDISNPAKPWPVCETWAFKCLDEFFAQIGFMDIFVQPTWELMGQVLTGVDLSNFEINRSNWKAREAFYDEELKKLNAEKAHKEKEKENEKEKIEIPTNK